MKKLSNIELDLEIKNLAQCERELLSVILEHIQECDRRRLYLEFGYPSLFSYLIKHIGYSEGSAQRRINAARLMTEIPDVQEKIESGKIQLSHISMIQKASRKVKASKEMKLEALENLESKSLKESEKIVMELFELPKDDCVRIELVLTKEQAEKLDQVKALMSHLIPDGNVAEIFDLLMTQKLAATVAVDSAKTNKTITTKTRQFVLQREKCCQFQSPITGKKCESRWQLQVDHIHSKWAGGTNNPQNLQAVCRQHNRHKYRKEAGIHLQ